jgi:predicted Zn-dependent protease
MTVKLLVVRATTALLAYAVVGLVHAAGLLLPLPAGELSKLSPEQRTELMARRAEFDQARGTLVGPYLADAYAKAAALYARYGVFDVTRVALTNAIALEPNDGRFEYLAGVFAAEAGDVAGARGHYERALKLDTEYLPIRYRLMAVQLQLNDLAGARATAEAVAKLRPELAPAHAALGEIAMRERRAQDAVAAFRKALAADPNATSLYGPLAQALEAAGDKAGAATARAKIGNGVSAYPDPLVQGIYAPVAADVATLALSLALEGKYAQARQQLDAALQAKPDDVAALAAYARIEADAGQLAKARAQAAAALKLAPNDAQANLAQAIVDEVGGNEKQAQLSYEKAVRADLKLGEARLLLGNLYMRLRQYNAAAEQYRQLVALDAKNGTSKARLAAAMALSGRCADALREINQGLRANARDGDLMQIFVRLAATCSQASAEERQMAVDYGQALYKQRPDRAHSEALAMALAATGKAKDAVDYQAQAMFDAIKVDDQPALSYLKPVLERYKAGQRAALAWPAGHPYTSPPRLTPSAAAPTRQ